MDDIDKKKDLYFQSLRKDVLPFVPEKADRILDIGCGDGLFGKYLKETRGAEVWGIEYNADSAKRAEANIDKVLSGDVAARLSELPDNYFDLVICNDVLEHLYDPYSVIEKLKAKIVLQGKIMSSIPHIRYFRAMISIIFDKQFKYADDGIFDRTHIRWFTKKSIREMFENAGYEVILLKGINKSKSIRPFLLNLMFWGLLSDSKYLQYMCIAAKT